MTDDPMETFQEELRETFSLIWDWRLYAALGIVLAGAFVVGLMFPDHRFGLWELALLAGLGMAIGISLRWLRLQEQREKADRNRVDE